MNGVRRDTAGVTLTELLVVLLIIAILGTIAVPVYLNRIETARVRTAQAEVRELAQAEEMVAATHGFYVPLQMLDNVVQPDISDPRADSIDNEIESLYLYKVNLPPTSQLGSDQFQLSDRTTNIEVNKLYNNWQGPFINFNRFFKGEDGGILKTSIMDSDIDEIRRDYPLDPWGQPYRFFGPLGVMGSDAYDSGTFTEWNRDATFDLRQNNYSGDSDRDPFDRFAIVSYGPNQEANTSTLAASGDDIVYVFGFVASETMFVP